MITVTDYTSYDEIRTVLGVDSIELTDSTLELQIFATALFRKLLSVTSADENTLVSLYSSIDPFNMTEGEEILYYTIKEFATYVVAEVCCQSISMFALKSDSDGKASQSRFSSEATFKDVVKNIRIRLAGLTGELDILLGGTAVSTVPGLTAVTPSIDLVTNQ